MSNAAKGAGLSATRRPRLVNVDIFAAFNALLFAGMCVTVYYDRFILYRGRENMGEFFIYATVIMLSIGIAWFLLRSYSFHGGLLLLIEAGILMHFAGGLVQLHGARLYDNIFIGIRYDKYVHFVNSLVGALMVRDFFRRAGIRMLRFESLVVILVVLGFGGVIEVVEYGVTRTVPHNGVGDYDNNMQDLVANLAGGLAHIVVAPFLRRSKGAG